jgi:hypothetical protein
LKLVAAGKGVSLRYDQDWLVNGFALSEDYMLVFSNSLMMALVSKLLARSIACA